MYTLVLDQLELDTLHAGMLASHDALVRLLCKTGDDVERGAILELIHTHESILAQIEESVMKNPSQ